MSSAVSTGTTCLNCGAALVADQRYCLTCGHPCSPVRLAFLDVLQSERAPQSPGVIGAPQGGYGPGWEQGGAAGSLQRYTGVFGLLTVLLVAGLIGLLVGHWVSASNAPTQSVWKIEGLGGLAAAQAPATSAPAATSTATPTATPSEAPATASSEAASETSEAHVKTPPPAPKRASSTTLNKLSHLKGKKYQQEINKLTEGDQPIETGGG